MEHSSRIATRWNESQTLNSQKQHMTTDERNFSYLLSLSQREKRHPNSDPMVFLEVFGQLPVVLSSSPQIHQCNLSCGSTGRGASFCIFCRFQLISFPVWAYTELKIVRLVHQCKQQKHLMLFHELTTREKLYLRRKRVRYREIH